ncbi:MULTISPECIES: histidine phosphatase family protein [unclassified Acinetobacter]|uniref:histidine phosphatase family protein n=1 Tax=unclassified Acinetobacter TaxID=196816 RepID=UPI0035BB7530
MSEKLKLSFIRHGETELLAGGKVLRGWTDDALTATGWTQMQNGFDHAIVDKQNFDAIITSDLQRCRLFSEHIAQKHDLPILINANFREIHFGDWENCDVATLFEQFPDELSQYWQSPSQFTPPNAESLTDFAQRIDTALMQINAFAEQYQAKNILVVTHGGVIKYLHCKAKNMPLDAMLTEPAELGTVYRFTWQNHHLALCESSCPL